jgi:predicted alpha/beta-hydrolase family hydrolase
MRIVCRDDAEKFCLKQDIFTLVTRLRGIRVGRNVFPDQRRRMTLHPTRPSMSSATVDGSGIVVAIRLMSSN